MINWNNVWSDHNRAASESDVRSRLLDVEMRQSELRSVAWAALWISLFAVAGLMIFVLGG